MLSVAVTLVALYLEASRPSLFPVPSLRNAMLPPIDRAFSHLRFASLPLKSLSLVNILRLYASKTYSFN